MALHITEAELARDIHLFIERARQGVEVVIEENHRAVAVIKAAPEPAGRKLSEIAARLRASGTSAAADPEFSGDVDEAVGMYREPWEPPALD
ncbi:MAG: hypothetical protein ABL995_20625 [Bryobacteraceae bacterium]